MNLTYFINFIIVKMIIIKVNLNIIFFKITLLKVRRLNLSI